MRKTFVSLWCVHCFLKSTFTAFDIWGLFCAQVTYVTQQTCVLLSGSYRCLILLLQHHYDVNFWSTDPLIWAPTSLEFRSISYAILEWICFLSWLSNGVSEVIMFSPCVFVTLFVCLCLYHDVCPDDLTMNDWCHTNNILQVHCWECLVVQVMFHALMTSSMTSPGHKVSQILKVIYLERRSKTQNVGNAHGYLSGLFNFRYNFR